MHGSEPSNSSHLKFDSSIIVKIDQGRTVFI